MLKRLYPSALAVLLALAGLGARAQNVNRHRCATDEEQERYFAAHPGAREAQIARNRQFEASALAQLQRGAGAVAGTPDVTIPVVVHVIHGGGSDNVSDAQINSAIAKINIDYQKLNADTASLSPLFQPIAASTGFQFRLAKRDPTGNCTTGITRTYAPELTTDDRSGAVKARIMWDTNRYLNIWLVSVIGIPSPSGYVVGYAQFPGQTAATDGLVIRHDFFGDLGTSSPARAAERTTTHEIGHWFNLLHPWGNSAVETPGNCGDTDYVADTPPTIGTYGCNLGFAPCGPVANVQNYMDYAACTSMFTQGQRTRMRAALTAFRTSLTTPANLAATGTNDGYVAPTCAPVAAFAATTSASVCVNTPITLRDFSANFTAAGGPLTYAWSFPGGTPATATGPTVSVRYPTAGFYTVTETVSNSVGSNTSTQTNLIRVEGPTGAEVAPFAQSFEDPVFPNLFPSPTLRNYTNSGVNGAGVAANYRWIRQANLPAADGNAYVVVSNRLYQAGGITTLVTPNISLAGVAGATLSFARAFALRPGVSNNDQLRVSYSSDCGLSWSVPINFNAGALSTQGLTPIENYVPAAPTDWQTLTAPIPAQFQGSGLFKVRLQMVNGSSQGNNFYFDNLRVNGVLGTKAGALAARGIGVYPNPLTSETAVHVTLATPGLVQVSVSDVLGRPVLTLPAKSYGAGAQTLPLLSAGHSLRAGLYVVRIVLDGETFSTKLTVE